MFGLILEDFYLLSSYFPFYSHFYYTSLDILFTL